MTYICHKYRNGISRRIYKAESKELAQEFAFHFNGFYFEFTPDEWHVSI